MKVQKETVRILARKGLTADEISKETGAPKKVIYAILRRPNDNY